jgi:hypothetical protein
MVMDVSVVLRKGVEKETMEWKAAVDCMILGSKFIIQFLINKSEAI